MLFIFCLPLQIHSLLFSPLLWEADLYGLINGLHLSSGFHLDLASERHCRRWESEKREVGIFFPLLPSLCGLHPSTKVYSPFRKPSLNPLWDPLSLPLLVLSGLGIVKAPCYLPTQRYCIIPSQLSPNPDRRVKVSWD